VPGARVGSRPNGFPVHAPSLQGHRPVTDVDKASEAVLLDRIRERHPQHAILSEESG
jgi:fructose-1,6-bisphosphatase/inositol monophosphatase family enzyme